MDRKQKARERSALWRKNNPEQSKENSRKFRKKNPEYGKEHSKVYRKRNPEKMKEYSLKGKLKVYNLTPKDYNQLFILQKGCCAICNRHQNLFKRALAVDHCHTTNQVRGLLCIHCNLKLGIFEKNKDTFINYLEKKYG